MDWRMRKVFVLIIVTILHLYLFANMLTAENNIEEANKICNKVLNFYTSKEKGEIPEYIPIEQWKGAQFIFLPISEKLQKYGYRYFKSSKFSNDDVPYNTFAGEIITVIEVDNSHQDGFIIKVQLETDKSIFKSEPLKGGYVPHLALLNDIAWSCRNILGSRLQLLRESYALENNPYETKVVTVENIELGRRVFAPVKIIYRNESGRKLAFRVHISGTNIWRDQDVSIFSMSNNFMIVD